MSEPGAELLFCENESNARRLWGSANPTPYVKDGINDRVVDGALDAVNPDGEGTKVAAHVRFDVPAGSSVSYRVRLAAGPAGSTAARSSSSTSAWRRGAPRPTSSTTAITPPTVDDQQAAVMRQALAGMLWSKQCYYYDVDVWLQEHHAHPLRSPTHAVRATRRGSTW